MNSKTNWDAVQRDESQKAHAAEVAGLKQELDIAKQSLECSADRVRILLAPGLRSGAVETSVFPVWCDVTKRVVRTSAYRRKPEKKSETKTKAPLR